MISHTAYTIPRMHVKSLIRQIFASLRNSWSESRCSHVIINVSNITAVSEVLATDSENGSQITCYDANGDWLFIMYYALKSIDHAIFDQH